MSRFPTQADLVFWNARHQPRWASRIKGRESPRLDFPNIDHVVNAHAGLQFTSGLTETLNMLVFVSNCIRRGAPVRERLLDLAADPCGPNPKKRAALARKWAARLQGDR